MKRWHALSEIISALMLTGIVVAASGGVLAAFGQNLGVAQSSILTGVRAQIRNSGKLVSVVYSNLASGNLVLQVYNYGYQPIAPAQVYVDGTRSSFTMGDANGNALSSIPANATATITISGTFTSSSGHTVDVVDTDGFSFEVKT